MVRGRIPIHNGTPLPTLPHSSARAQIFWITCFCIPAKRIRSRRPYRHLLVFSKCIEQIRLPRLQPPSASNRRFFFSSLPLWSPPVPLCSRPDSCLLRIRGTVPADAYRVLHSDADHDGWRYVPDDFTLLARDTLSCPVSGVLVYGWPDETRRHQVLSGVHPWMGKSVERNNTSHCKEFGTYDREVSPDTSQYISMSWSGKRIFSNRNADVLELMMLLKSLSVSCAAARVRWSTDFPIASVRDRASTTLLFSPLM